MKHHVFSLLWCDIMLGSIALVETDGWANEFFSVLFLEMSKEQQEVGEERVSWHLASWPCVACVHGCALQGQSRVLFWKKDFPAGSASMCAVCEQKPH